MKTKTKAFCTQFSNGIVASGVKIGSEASAEVQLIKEYGLIAQLSGDSEIKTGFILNDHKQGQKYKQGQTLACRILDVDPKKKIVDLKEVDKNMKVEGKAVKKGQTCKGNIELNKEAYAIVSMKTNRSQLGLCLL